MERNCRKLQICLLGSLLCSYSKELQISLEKARRFHDVQRWRLTETSHELGEFGAQTVPAGRTDMSILFFINTSLSKKSLAVQEVETSTA